MPALPGRRREFTYHKRRELLDHIGQGASVEEAAQIVGVSLRTVQREARLNEFFDHDLHLAVHAAPTDPHKLVQRAARTHWRAAAWLLERTDPDRFAKRPPNSCSPETLMDISAWLIETALEATPPEHRENVHRRMRAVADKAFDVLMPDQHDARRCLVGALPHRPMPLSDHEVVKTLRVVDDRRAPAAGLPSAPAGRLPAAPPASEHDAEPPGASPAGAHPNGHNRDATHRRSAAGAAAIPMTRLSPTAPDATGVADPVAWYRRHPPQRDPTGRPSTQIQGVRLQDSDAMDAAWRYPLPEEEDEDADADGACSPVGGVSDADSAAAGAGAPALAERDPPPHECANEPAPLAPAGGPSVDPPNGGNYVAKNERGDKIGRDKTRTDRPPSPSGVSSSACRRAASSG